MPINTLVEYNMVGQLLFPPYQAVYWTVYNTPDITGQQSGYYGQLQNIGVASTYNLSPANDGYNMPTGPAGGDLSGFYPAPIVVGAEGYQFNFNLSTQSDGYAITWNNGTWILSPVVNRFVAAGDLSGTNLTQRVIGLQGRPVGNISPTDGYVLTWNGTEWLPEPVPAGGTVTLAGDVTGLSSSTTVAKLQGVVISGTPSDGYVLEATSPTAASWQALSIFLSGDVFGVYSDTVIDQITGTGSNQYTGTGTSVNILATESILGARTTNEVYGVVNGVTTTDGTTWVTIFAFTPTADTGNDWLVSLIGLDVTTNNPITGNFYRADLQFTSITVSGFPPVLYPATPTALNTQSFGAGSTYSVQVVVTSNMVEVQVRGKASTTVNWSGSLQNMAVS